MKENKLNALLQVSGLNLDNIFKSVVTESELNCTANKYKILNSW